MAHRPMSAWWSLSAHSPGIDAERDIRGFSVKFYTEEGNWDMVGNNTPVFFMKDPLHSLISTMRRNVIRAPICAVHKTIGISGHCCLKPCTR